MDNETKEYLTFLLGETNYAIQLNKIREILTYPDNITLIPKTKKDIKGLINLRGEVVPVIDLRIKFNLNEVIYNDSTTVIAIKTEDDRMIGVVVDKVNDVKKINKSDILNISEIGNTIPIKFLTGFTKNEENEENEMIIVMNIENIVKKEELSK